MKKCNRLISRLAFLIDYSIISINHSPVIHTLLAETSTHQGCLILSQCAHDCFLPVLVGTIPPLFCMQFSFVTNLDILCSGPVFSVVPILNI